MTSPINFGGGVGTQPVIQNPGLGEQLAPLLEALQSGQQQQAQAELLALKTQLTETQLATAQAQIDANERTAANDEAMGTVLQQLVATAENQQVALPGEAGVGAATVPVQSPDLNELVQDLPPEIVAETLKRGQPIQDRRDELKANQLAGIRLRDRRVAAVMGLSTGLAQEMLLRKYEMDAAGVDPATQRLILQTEMRGADQARINRMRKLPIVAANGWDAFPDDQMVELYLNYQRDNIQRGDQYGRAGMGGVAQRESESEAFNKYIADRENHVRSADGIVISDYDEELRGMDFDQRQGVFRIEWNDLQKSDKAAFRWMAEQGMNRKLSTPPDQMVGPGIGDEELAMSIAGVIASARREGALVGEGQIGFIRRRETSVTPGPMIGLSPGLDDEGMPLPVVPDPMELIEGALRARFAAMGLDLERQRFQRVMMRGYWLSRGIDSHLDVAPAPPRTSRSLPGGRGTPLLRPGAGPINRPGTHQ